MYACESIWFQKEERRKTLYKTIGNYAGIGFLILLILAFVFFLIGGFFSKVPENHTLLQEETINQTMNNAENIVPIGLDEARSATGIPLKPIARRVFSIVY